MSKRDKDTILVTGGAGFLGSHLCQRLISFNYNVICLDNFFSGKKENIKHLLGDSRFELIRHDICDPINLVVDKIYNLACPASPKFYQLDPVNTINTNVRGAINVLEIAKKNNAKVLQASTSEVYGSPSIHPQGEEYWGNVNPIGMRSCYDEGKRCAESLFFDYHRQYGVKIKVARIFNTYGPNMYCGDGRVVSNFVVQALQGKDITIYGSGGQTRSFCYVNDTISGLIKLMDSNDIITGPVNIGNPVEITIKELASKILEITKSSSKIIYKDLPTDDPDKRKPDINKAKLLLDWEPTVDLKIGLNETINYFKEII